MWAASTTTTRSTFPSRSVSQIRMRKRATIGIAGTAVSAGQKAMMDRDSHGAWETRAVRWLLPLLLALTAPAHGFWKKHQPNVLVDDPYLELHTGPGRGYPVFHVVGEGEEVTILKRRTDWFKVQSPRGKKGWVPLKQMRRTLDLDGETIDFGAAGLDDFAGRRWDFGVNGGDFGGAASLSGYLGFALTQNITLQLSGTQLMGNFSDGYMGNVNVLMNPFPRWRVSPYFTIGTGIIKTEPSATIVQTEDRTDEIVHAGLGLNTYLSDRFMLRVEYKRHTVLTSRDDNEEINQWKAGFSIFL